IKYGELFYIPYLKDSSGALSKDDVAARVKKTEGQLEKLTELHGIFKSVVSPLANCIIKAIENGYHVDSVRADLRPVADLLTLIISLEKRGGNPNDADAVRQAIIKARSDFWAKLLTIPDTIGRYVDGEDHKKCLEIKNASMPDPSRRHSDFAELPHLFAARSF